MESGYQVTFFTQQGHLHGDKPQAEWLMALLAAMGIQGATMMVCQEGIGHHHHLHTYHLFSTQDLPVEVSMVVTAADCDRVFARLNEEDGLALFYARTPVEFGEAGGNSGSNSTT